MGITKLLQTIKKYSPTSMKTKLVSDFSSKVLAVDASIPMYEFLTQLNRVKDESILELKDSEGNPTAHLMGLLSRSLFLIRNQIYVREENNL
jgi:flap endonuclease-1